MSVVDLGRVPPIEDTVDTDTAADAVAESRRPDAAQPASSPDLSFPARGERTGVTLPELLHLAGHLGVTLPFTLPSTETSTLAARLGAGSSPLPDFLAAFPDPEETLLARGLIARTEPADEAAEIDPEARTETGAAQTGADRATVPEPGAVRQIVVLPWLAHALRVLSGAEVSVDLEVSLAGATVRSWHHAAGDAVTALSSANGVIYEVALLPIAGWHHELERVVTPPGTDGDAAASDLPQAGRPASGSPLARLSGDHVPPTGHGTVPDGLQLPLELFMAGTQALEEGRSDVAGELLRRYAGQSTLPDAPAALEDTVVLRHLQGLSQTTGRVRALVTSRNTSTDAATRIPATAAAGVLSWVLLGDGWRHLNPIGCNDDPQVRLDLVEPADLGPCVSALIAQVLR